MKPEPFEIRIDAAEKLEGTAEYIRDMKVPGMWYGKTIRSIHANAEIVNIQFDPHYDWSKLTYVTAEEVPYNVVAMLETDMPFLAEKKVNYYGEPILLLAAENSELLKEAEEHIQIEYRKLPALFDMKKSAESEIKIFKENNTFKEIKIQKGDLNKAAADADFIIEMEAETGYQEHLYLEPQGIIAIPKDEKIEIHGSMQCPYYIKNALNKMFNEKIHVTVIQSVTGGAFGGKEDYPSLLAGHAALLANKCKHPVAMFYDREEDVQFTTKRHPSYHKDKAFVTKEGKILGLDLNVILDGGAYCTLSQVVLARAALTAAGCYFIPNITINAKAVATNTPPNGAFRGFGGPQAIFALEMLIEKIANELKMNPADVRKINLIKEGETTATSQILKYSVSAHETVDDVIQRSDYQNKHKKYAEHNKRILEKILNDEYPKENSDQKLKGIGVSAFQHGAGFTGTGENVIKGKIRVEINNEGKPVIFSAQTEMGQGEQTAFQIILAKSLNINVDDVIMSEVNTDLVPNSGPTVASRSTMIVGSLLVDAGKEIINQLTDLLNSENPGWKYEEGSFINNGSEISFIDASKKLAGLKIEKQYEHPPIIKFDDINWIGDAYPVFSWAASVAEVEVDPVTFEIKVTKYYTTHDIGKAINKDQAEAQIQGGSLQGIGYAIYEKVKIENEHYDIKGFADYIIPTPTEMPVFDVKIMENPYPYGPFGAKGLGELPLVGGAPAVLSALWMIFGKEFNKIPVMPEDLLVLFNSNQKVG